MKIVKYSWFGILLICVVGCINENDFDTVQDNPVDNTISEEPLAGLNVMAGFDYSTTKNISVSLSVPDFLKSAVVDIYTKTDNQDSLAIGTGTFDSNGNLQKSFALSQRADSVLVFSKYAGLVSELRLPIENNTIAFDYRPLYERTANSGKHGDYPPKLAKSAKSNATLFNYLDTFNSLGVPDNMAFPDVIQQNLLDDINASFPENVRGGIPATNPEFLAGTETQLVLTQEADVWVTFVSEGAGYRNTLGYYTYPVGEEPESVDEITHNIIFPNASMLYSGGGLVPGDRVYLGRFQENTVVSWFLVAQGWRGSQVEKVANIYYSQPDFNPETTADKRQHMVMLYDAARDITLLGFEDLFREGYSDEDFNDAVFYAKSNPPSAIQVGNMAKIVVANDADGDGVNDELDDFPFDANKAFSNFAPAQNSTGKLAYEDLWPSMGDYDFNDLVVGYNYNLIANVDNMVTAIDASFTIEQIGGSFKNGFAITFPVNPQTVERIEGQILNGGYEEVATNGTESGTANNETVVFIAGNVLEMEGDSINVNIEFKAPVSVTDLGTIPFNPFLIVNGDRFREVHLPDLPPSSKGELYLGTKDDYSDEELQRFYKTNRNLPWALNLYEGFVPPPETIPITIQYPRFITWANSGGTEQIDWYLR